MTVESVPFEHVIVDLSLRDVTTSKGEVVTFCQIEANAPLDYQSRELGDFYSWGRVIEAQKPFEIVCECFVILLIKHCCGDMGVFVIAHTVPEEPTFQALVYEGDELIAAKVSGDSLDLKASFIFAWFNANQRLRIETIPDFETYAAFREAVRDRRKERGQ